MSRGRPRTLIDEDILKTVYGMSARFCSQEEIAEAVQITVKTLKKNNEFLRTYKKGFDKGKAMLRSKQFEIAMAGDKAMLIWMGKQHLGQCDNPLEMEIKLEELELKKTELNYKMNHDSEQSVEYEKLKDFLAVLTHGASIPKTE